MRKERRHAEPFQDNRKWEDGGENFFRFNATFGGKARFKESLLVKSRFHSGKEQDRRRKSHDAETADLDESGKNPKPSMGKGRSDVDDGKARDADGGSRREKGV